MGLEWGYQTAINLIQFAIKLDILQATCKKNLMKVIRREMKKGELAGCTERQGKRWMEWGCRFAEFAGAGEDIVSVKGPAN